MSGRARCDRAVAHCVVRAGRKWCFANSKRNLIHTTTPPPHTQYAQQSPSPAPRLAIRNRETANFCLRF